MTLSCMLAICLACLSFATFYVARDVFHVDNDVLHSIMYLHISSAPHFVIFSTRVPGYWWEQPPHWLFTVCILGTQVVALFFSVYGVFGPTEHVAPCGWPWGLAVLGISLVYFMLLDVVSGGRACLLCLCLHTHRIILHRSKSGCSAFGASS
jgi:H+-transporting ATPase